MSGLCRRLRSQRDGMLIASKGDVNNRDDAKWTVLESSHASMRVC